MIARTTSNEVARGTESDGLPVGGRGLWPEYRTNEPRGLTVTRSLRHRLARRRLSPYVWGCVPVISPYLDRLRAAAFEPCWRTSPEGREYVAALERLMNRPPPTTH